MYRVLVYPYNQGDSCLAEYRSMLEQYEIVSLVCLKGANENGKFAGVQKDTSAGILITENYEGEMDKCDAVLFLEYHFLEHKDTYIEKMGSALLKNKVIMLNQTIYDECQKLIGDSSNIVIFDNSLEMELRQQVYKKRLVQPDIPVAAVMSLGENCNKFEAQLELRKKFMEKGYKVLQFGTKDYCELFGFKKLPSFLMAEDLSIVNKIHMFNYYINREVLKDNYDVIVIGGAGGILPFDQYISNHFGEITFIISSALNIDINVICIYHNDQAKVEELKEFREYCKGKIGCFSDYFYMSDKQYRIPESHQIEYFQLDRQYCIKSIPEIKDDDIKFCHCLDEEKKSQMLDSIICELEENIELV
ncbi:TIGR04066 family peptide maturation system protein [Anaeromicropila populeti]|uniref:Peptide maturation system protein, TIGR04066 family n=1 Tax=Anaeromicropila populeti TaxID=37658 RepID=A0A1I6IDB2_9FIRM|nr:TIGR04066 family peptide maturation system protein [Anaeromicropila populeti]SFR64722.1 peptide maturation system protein, TIGR04066 family [Anaeromicropila populeti]